MGDTKITRKRKRVSNKKFARLFYDFQSPVAFTGTPSLLARAAGSTVNEAEHWLSGQTPYTLHKHVKKPKYPKIIVSGLDHQWGVDLMDVRAISGHNDGYNFLLCAVDSLSKFAWVRPLIDKTGPTVTSAMSDIFLAGRVPRKIRTDSGGEFKSRQYSALMKDYNIIHFIALNPVKEAIVERFNRTLRARMWRYFEATNSERYIDILQKLVNGYNNTIHRTIGKAPSQVNTLNQNETWLRLYGHLLGRWRGAKDIKSTYAVGDTVKISKYKQTFEQGYKTTWSDENFIVDKVIKLSHQDGYKYRLRDLNGEPIIGTFMRAELQKVSQAIKRIRRVVKRDSEGRTVTWRDHPNSLKTWISDRT